MIPNRFDDYTNEPQYNTVHASLWFIRLLRIPRLANDQPTFDKVLVLRAGKSSIATVAARAGIRMMKPMAHHAGDEHTRPRGWTPCGDIAFTPRQETGRSPHCGITRWVDEESRWRISPENFPKPLDQPFRGLQTW